MKLDVDTAINTESIVLLVIAILFAGAGIVLISKIAKR